MTNGTNGDHIQTGDVRGNGIFIGKNIHIAGDVIIGLANEARGLGLNLLKPTYFEEYRATDQDFEDWKEGFSFKLSSIKEHYEFRRSLVDQIKMKIENHHQLLLVGEMGTSKSTILMEIICEYFEKGFKILYNFGDSDLTNGTEIIHFIENLLDNDNNVLVAVDDVHSERAAAIFYVMDELSNYKSNANVRFVLTAGLPEFEWYVNDKLGKVKEGIYRESIRKFWARPTFRFELPFYTKEEIKAFIKLYGKIEHLIQKIRDPLNAWSDEFVYHLISENIYNDTAKGHPLMVKFSVLGKGLRNDVERRYENYLRNPEQSEEAYAMKMTTMLVCSLLDIAGLPISEELLEDMDLLSYAADLEGATLYSQSAIGWKTIHPKWDIELLSYLYDPNDKRKLLKNKVYIKKAVDLILKLKDKEELIASVIETLYTIPLICSVPLNIIEDTIKEIPDYLSDDKKAKLFGMIIAITYYKLNRYDKALENCDKALDLNRNFLEALYNKGKILDELGNYEEALQYYDKSIGVEPKYIIAWNNRGLAYAKLGDYNNAIQSYDKAIEIMIDYPFAWYNRGLTFYELGKYAEAIKSYDEAIKARPQYYDAWFNRGLAYAKLGDYNNAIQSYDKTIEMQRDPESPINAVPLYNRACSRVKIGLFEEGLSDLVQAIRIGGPKYRELAELEKDFDDIRNEERFKDIIM